MNPPINVLLLLLDLSAAFDTANHAYFLVWRTRLASRELVVPFLSVWPISLGRLLKHSLDNVLQNRVLSHFQYYQQSYLNIVCC